MKTIKIEDLKPGMEVMLRNDLEDVKIYGFCCWHEQMLKGRKVTIERIDKGNRAFFIEEDQEGWYYTPEMIDHIIDKPLTEDQTIEELKKLGFINIYQAHIYFMSIGHEFGVSYNGGNYDLYTDETETSYEQSIPLHINNIEELKTFINFFKTK